MAKEMGFLRHSSFIKKKACFLEVYKQIVLCDARML